MADRPRRDDDDARGRAASTACRRRGWPRGIRRAERTRRARLRPAGPVVQARRTRGPSGPPGTSSPRPPDPRDRAPGMTGGPTTAGRRPTRGARRSADRADRSDRGWRPPGHPASRPPRPGRRVHGHPDAGPGRLATRRPGIAAVRRFDGPRDRRATGSTIRGRTAPGRPVRPRRTWLRTVATACPTGRRSRTVGSRPNRGTAMAVRRDAAASAPDRATDATTVRGQAAHRPAVAVARPIGGRPPQRDRSWSAPRPDADWPRPALPAPGCLGPDEELVAGRRPVEEAFAAGRPAHPPAGRAAAAGAAREAGPPRHAAADPDRRARGRLAHRAGRVRRPPGRRPRRRTPRRSRRSTTSWPAPRERAEPPFVLVLDSLEDPQNVGTLLRSAEAAGVHGVVFPDPPPGAPDARPRSRPRPVRWSTSCSARWTTSPVPWPTSTATGCGSPARRRMRR